MVRVLLLQDQMIVTNIYLYFLTPTESPRNHGAGMFSLDVKGVHVDRCTRDKETETQIDGEVKERGRLKETGEEREVGK